MKQKPGFKVFFQMGQLVPLHHGSLAPGAGHDEWDLTALRAARMASLLGVGFIALAVSFVALAVSPKMHPRALEGVKCVTVAVVIGCVAVADTLPGVSNRAREQPQLFVAAVAGLHTRPRALVHSPLRVTFLRKCLSPLGTFLGEFFLKMPSFTFNLRRPTPWRCCAASRRCWCRPHQRPSRPRPSWWGCTRSNPVHP
jgi:hypothetical protein